MLETISPSWLIARGKKRVIERRRMLNIERHRKAVSAVTTYNFSKRLNQFEDSSTYYMINYYLTSPVKL